MDFSIAINCLGIFRNITEKVNDLSLAALNLICVEKDLVTLLVFLIEAAPWIRKHHEFERFDQGKWIPFPEQDIQILSKVEGQANY